MRILKILLFLLVCIELNSIAQSNIPERKKTPYSTIIGAWISEVDNKWKLTFTVDNKCHQYYDNILSETDTVIISNTTPQCGVAVDVDTYTNYLQQKNIADTTDKQCYLINGITNTNLSISVVDEVQWYLLSSNSNSINFKYQNS